MKTAYVVPTIAGSRSTGVPEGTPSFSSLAEAIASDAQMLLLDDGVYELQDEPLHIRRSLKVAAVKGACPIISGGRQFRGGWTAHEGHIYRRKLEGILQRGQALRGLFAEGMDCRRARWPRDDDPSPHRRDREGTPTTDARFVETGLRIQHYIGREDNYARVSGLADDYKKVILDRELPEGFQAKHTDLVAQNIWSQSRAEIVDGRDRTLQLERAMGTKSDWWSALMEGQQVYLENAYGFLQENGDWFYDPDEQNLYLYAQDGAALENTAFTVPVLETFLFVEGEGISFNGITFAYGGYQIPAWGFYGLQAHFYYGEDMTERIPEKFAVQVTASTDFRVENCRFMRSLGGGLLIGEKCRDVCIHRCEFFGIGSTALAVGHGRAQADAVDPYGNITISGCHIHHNGYSNNGSVGLWTAFMKNTVIEDNHIHDLPYSGMSVGWRWDDEPTNAAGLRIRRNYIHDVMQMLCDGAGIYLLGNIPDTVVEENLLCRSVNGNGFQLDQGTCHMVLRGNVVNGAGHEAVHINPIHDVTFEGNTLAGAPVLLGYYHWQDFDYSQYRIMDFRQNRLIAEPGVRVFHIEAPETEDLEIQGNSYINAEDSQINSILSWDPEAAIHCTQMKE